MQHANVTMYMGRCEDFHLFCVVNSCIHIADQFRIISPTTLSTAIIVALCFCYPDGSERVF